jgi:glycosyltransferase involved in cell wall biosynthesis
MTTLPKVSGIMPVGCGDRYFIVAANAFLSQRYEGELELVIVDNSDESIESLLPVDDRIVYHRCARMAVGALRNLGTSLSTGDVCVSIDEDDWSHPDRIATQVQRLIDTGKAVTGFHSIFYYDTHNDSTFKYWYEPAGRNHPPYACGSSQMYTRAWWTKHKFPETGVEDYPFSRNALNHNQLDSIDAAHLFVARAHSDSTCYPKQLGVHRQFPAVPRAALPAEFFTAINPITVKPAAKQKAKRNQKTSNAPTQE